MLSPQYLANSPKEILTEFRKLENDVIEDIARRIRSMEKISATSGFQLNLLYDPTESPVMVTEKLDSALMKYGDSIYKHLQESGEYALDQFGRIYEQNVGVLPLDYNPTPFMNNIVTAIGKQLKTEVMTLSKTTGFILDNKFVPRHDYLREMLNTAAFQISSGAFTYEQVSRRYIKELGDKGIRVFDFESGTTREMESHLKRIILDATRQLSNELSINNAESLGTDLMEISAHSGARPGHALWQGQLVSRSGRRGYLTFNDIGYGDVNGFGGANCRHSMYPYFEGSRRMYPPRVLKELAGRSNEYNGKTYDDYMATQKQRAYERGLRASQRRMKGFKAAGDMDAYNAELIRYRRKVDEYKDFSRAMGQKIRRDNLFIYQGPGGTFEGETIIKKTIDREAAKQSIIKKQGKAVNKIYQKEFIKIMDNWTDEELFFYDHYSDVVKRSRYNIGKKAYYSPSDKTITMNMKNNDYEFSAKNGKTGAWHTKFHEEFHQVDHMLVHTDFIENELQRRGYAISSKFIDEAGGAMQTAIKKDITKLINDDLTLSGKTADLLTDYKDLTKLTEDQINAYWNAVGAYGEGLSSSQHGAAVSMLTDAAGLMSEDKLSPHKMGYWGHDSDYNLRGSDGSTSETWATYGSHRLNRDTVGLAAMEKLMPETVKIYDQIYNKVMAYIYDGGVLKYYQKPIR